MSSQLITSHVYQWLLYLLTNQIAHQGFWIFNWLKLSLDSEDGFCTVFGNVSDQQQSFWGLQSPRWSFSIKVSNSLVETIFLVIIGLSPLVINAVIYLAANIVALFKMKWWSQNHQYYLFSSCRLMIKLSLALVFMQLVFMYYFVLFFFIAYVI